LYIIVHDEANKLKFLSSSYINLISDFEESVNPFALLNISSKQVGQCSDDMFQFST
jgi:hypothetical protein